MFQPLRDPAGSSPQGLGAVTSLGISSFYDLPARPPSDADQPPLAACSVGVDCSQPLWNATATRTPLPRPQAPRTGQGAEQGPQGEGWPRREGEDRGDEGVSQKAGNGSREVERAQPWGDKTGGLKSPKQLLGGPPALEPPD